MRQTELFLATIDHALTTGRMVRFRAEGESMYPTIRDGDVITVAAVSTHDIVRGDLLLCRHARHVLAHRVVETIQHGAERVFLLKGDAKAACDEPVAADAVIGQVIAVSRDGRVMRVRGRAARVRHRFRSAASTLKTFAGSMIRIVRPAVLR
jgi:signal peptidase I